MKKAIDKKSDEIRVSEGGGVTHSQNKDKDDKDKLYKNKVFRQFVDFFALPEPERCEFLEIPFDTTAKKYKKTATLKEFAKKFGVHTDTLRVWKKREDFVSAVDSKRKEWGSDRVSNVLAALYRRCVRYGMSYDVETYLAFYMGWDKKKAIEESGTKFDMNDIRAIIAPLPKDKQEEFYAIITNIITEAESARGDSQVQGDQLNKSETDQG